MAYTNEQIDDIKNRILESLEQVIDPELGIDIVNLGLIYEIRFNGENGETQIDMTLTTMGCPLADLLTDQIHDAMSDVPEVSKEEQRTSDTFRFKFKVKVSEIDKMSRYARIALGIK